MNAWLTGACIIAILLWTGACVLTGRSWAKDSCQAEIEASIAAAEKNVVTIMGKQETITQGVENAHHTGVSIIDNLYRVQPTSGSGNMSTVPHGTGRPDVTTCRPSPTKYYRLKPQECDDNTQQLIDLQAWVREQQAVQ